MSLVKRLVSKRKKQEKQAQLLKEVGRRRNGYPQDLDDIPERNYLQRILDQAETATDYESTRIIKKEDAEKPGYVGKHWYYPWIHRMAVVVPALEELQARKQEYRDQGKEDLWHAQWEDLWRVVKFVWCSRHYHKAITSYAKHGHILGPKTAEAWKFDQEEQAEAASKAVQKTRKKQRRKRK